MNQTVSEQASAHGPEVCLARLCEPYGYRFVGGKVHLQARFMVLDHAARQRRWALQLWACPSAPTSAGDLAGRMVAELALPPIKESAGANERLEMSGTALPPAGDAEHVMALVLAAGRAGHFDEVHDVVSHARRERFLQAETWDTAGFPIHLQQGFELPLRPCQTPFPLRVRRTETVLRVMFRDGDKDNSLQLLMLRRRVDDPWQGE